MKSKQHLHLLGLSASVLSLLVIFSLTTPGHVFQTAQIMTASAIVGVTAGVAPNPDNTLAQQLEERERALHEREAQVARMEGENQTHTSSNDILALSSVVLSGVVLVLVGVNFYLDTRRTSRPQFAVDLRRS